MPVQSTMKYKSFDPSYLLNVNLYLTFKLLSLFLDCELYGILPDETRGVK